MHEAGHHLKTSQLAVAEIYYEAPIKETLSDPGESLK